MKALGIILTILGLIASIIFAVQVSQNSETFNFLGIQIGVSSANWTPLIVSGLVFVAGIIIWIAAGSRPGK